MTNTTSAAVAGEIRAIMARRGVSSRDLAAELDVSPMWVTRRTRGIVNIDVDDLERIATVLKTDAATIIEAAQEARAALASPEGVAQ